MEKAHETYELRQMQSLPLRIKIRMTQRRIREWVDAFGTDGVYVSFSGGKDSTVLLDIVRGMFPSIPAAFVNVPTQYPELRSFAEGFDNVVVLEPGISFAQVCGTYGLPLISKEVSGCVQGARKYLRAIKDGQKREDAPYWYYYDRLMGECQALSLKKYGFLLDAPFEVSAKCCDVMKKAPVHKYSRETGRLPITAQMASESRLRLQKWMQYGCNAFDSNAPISNPMSFWTDQDVLEYVYINGLPICSVYGDVVRDGGQLSLEDFGMDVPSAHHYRTTGCDRTGGMLCGFGCHLEKRGKGRFLRLKETHPGVYGLLDMVSNNGYTMRQAIGWTNENGNLHIEC